MFQNNFSDLHGTWEKEGGNTFTSTLLQQMFDPDTRDHVGYLRVLSTYVVEGDTLTGDSIIGVILGPGPPALPDPFTDPVFPGGSSTFVGRRISVE